VSGSPSAVTKPQREPCRQDDCGRCDTRPQNPQRRPREATWRPPRNEPPLIGQCRHRDQGEQRLEPLQPKGAAGRQNRYDSKSCQDLRQHSSTGDQQRRENRNRACRLGPVCHV
jgi:hypothetical protein